MRRWTLREIPHPMFESKPLSVQDLPRCRLPRRIETQCPLRAVNAPIPPLDSPCTSRNPNGLGGVRRTGRMGRRRVVNELDEHIAQERHLLRNAVRECLGTRAARVTTQGPCVGSQARRRQVVRNRKGLDVQFQSRTKVTRVFGRGRSIARRSLYRSKRRYVSQHDRQHVRGEWDMHAGI